MLKLGEVFLDRRGEIVYIPDRNRPPFTSETPVELRNMLVNAVLRIVKAKAGAKATLVVQPMITCMYPKRHRHDKGEPYTDSEILLARSGVKKRRQSSGSHQHRRPSDLARGAQAPGRVQRRPRSH